MSNNRRSDFVHVQLASIIEVLANTAVAQICKLVDDGYASLRMEISQSQREIDNLRRKLLVAKCQGSRRSHLERLALRRTVAVRGRPKSSIRKPDMIVVDEEYELPIAIKLESVACSKPRDIQPSEKQNCQANSVGLSNPFKESQATSLCIEPNNQQLKNSQELNRNADQRLSMLLHHVPQPNNNNQQCFGDINWESCPPSSSTNCVFPNISQWQEDISHIETWNNAEKFPHNPSAEPSTGRLPHCIPLDRCGGGQTKPEAVHGSLGSDGTGVGDSVDMGDVVFKLDWEPAVSVDACVTVKLEEDLCSQENEPEGELRPGQMSTAGRHAKGRREGGERNGGDGLEAAIGQRTGPGPGADVSPLSGRMATGDNRTGPSSSSRGALRKLPDYLLPSAAVHKGSGEGNCFRCEVCGKTFTRIPLLRSHQRVHTGEKPFGCRHCSKRFSHRHQMNNHERIHTGEKPFSCPVCGRRFVQSNHVKRHLHIHTELGKL